MTQKKTVIRIYNGPSWEVIERSLRDTEHGLRTVEFGFGDERSFGMSTCVQLTSAKRLDDTANSWELSGMTRGDGRSQRVVINFGIIYKNRGSI